MDKSYPADALEVIYLFHKPPKAGVLEPHFIAISSIVKPRLKA
jgi:hypothetical protein